MSNYFSCSDELHFFLFWSNGTHRRASHGNPNSEVKSGLAMAFAFLLFTKLIEVPTDHEIFIPFP